LPCLSLTYFLVDAINLFSLNLLLNHMFAARVKLLFYYLLSCTCLVFWMILGEWWFHVCALRIQMQITNVGEQTLESFPISFRILVGSYHNILFCFLGLYLLASILDHLIIYHPFAIFGSLILWISFKYLSLDMCICFYSNIENVAYLCFICASPGLTASTHSYKMKYQEYKGLYYIAWSTNNIVFYNSKGTKPQTYYNLRKWLSKWTKVFFSSKLRR
jgi:hypothetical protein